MKLSLIILGCIAVGGTPPSALAETAAAEPAASTIGLELATPVSFSYGNKLGARGVEFRDVDIASSGFGLNQTIPLEKASLRVGLEHSLYTTHVRNNGVVPLPKHLQSVGVPVALILTPGGSWSWTVAATPGWSVAGSSLRGDGFGVNVLALGTCEYSSTFSYSLGVVYDSLASGRYRVFPVFGTEWKPTEHWSVALGVPRTGVTYRVNDALRFSLEASGNAGTFHVKDDPLPNRAFKPDLSNSKLEYAEARLGFSVAYRVNKHVSLTATAGHVLLSELEYRGRNYKLKSKGIAPFVAASAAFSF